MRRFLDAVIGPRRGGDAREPSPRVSSQSELSGAEARYRIGARWAASCGEASSPAHCPAVLGAVSLAIAAACRRGAAAAYPRLADAVGPEALALALETLTPRLACRAFADAVPLTAAVRAARQKRSVAADDVRANGAVAYSVLSDFVVDLDAEALTAELRGLGSPRRPLDDRALDAARREGPAGGRLWPAIRRAVDVAGAGSPEAPLRWPDVKRALEASSDPVVFWALRRAFEAAAAVGGVAGVSRKTLGAAAFLLFGTRAAEAARLCLGADDDGDGALSGDEAREAARLLDDAAQVESGPPTDGDDPSDAPTRVVVRAEPRGVRAAPAAPAGGRCGDWDCLYAKAGPKKRPTWIDGVVKREENGSQDRLTLIDVATGSIITRASVKVSTPTFEDDEEYETYFSKFKIQIQGRKGGAAPAPAPAAPPRARAPAPVAEAGLRRAGAGAARRAARAAPGAPRPRPRARAARRRAAAAPAAPRRRRSPRGRRPRRRRARPPSRRPRRPRAAAPPGEDEFEVVAEPRVAIRGPLARKLRPHQRDAAKFLYRALSGRQPRGGCGAILADEMGLGKTLATLTTLRLLVKAAGSCVNGDADVPKVRKAAVLWPASLVGQWPDEDAKFFGRVSSNVTWVACLETAGGALDGGTESAKTALERWRALDGRRSCAVLAISYESFQRYFASHIEGDLQLDLLVFDEGHRLKGGAGSKTARAIRDCRAKRRLLITGTPAMNDLSEFHALADVVNPDVFGPLAAFRRDVARPIEAGAVRGASRDKRLAATEAKDALRARAAAFYLRRTAADRCAAAADVGALAKIQRLRALATRGADGDRAASGKLDVAFALLAHLRARPAKERAVLVSTSTVTLDACARECESRGWPAARLDGSTPAGERQGLVNAFNRPRSDAFVFLLSTRAGGCGLNLVGASRLLLLDPDWNPAADEQAMARVWRDGQTRPVHVYRLLGAGTVDEKIFMRQLGKHDVNDGVVDDAATAGRFTAAELADLFAYDPDVASTTYDAQRHAAATRRRGATTGRQVPKHVLSRGKFLIRC
ncbi:hypothetical protein JL720_1136 [Aureococcus anophagefferens]|nr:hypothetical protein JL720_1136 [Aureococcus anophagefferens]